MGTFAKVLGFMALFLVLCPAARAQTARDDQSVASAVEDALAAERGMTFDLIDVFVESGVVTLNGRVSDLPVKLRAREVCETIRGVQAVVDRLTVQTPERTDAEIREDIKTALSHDPFFRARDIKVNVKAGIAVLSGTLSSYPEKELARRIAVRIKGLRDVVDEIVLERAASRPDREIESDVRRRFRYDAFVHPGSITPAVTGGKVILTGTAGTPFERNRAYLLSWVSGVAAVEADALTVAWPVPAGERRIQEVSLADADVAAAVRASLRFSPRLAGFDPRVDISSGIATLSGSVGDLRARQAAEEAAKRVIGVTRVVNRIKVRPASIPEDDVLAVAAKYALASDATLYRYDIAVSAANGIVYLRGTVDNLFDRSLAEEPIAGIGGVVRVENGLDILRQWSFKGDTAITATMLDLLDNSAYFAEHKVTVRVTDGIMSLQGSVPSVTARGLAEETGYKAGARSVLNYLQVWSPAKR